LVARYVVPEVNGLSARLRASQQYLHDHQTELMGGASRAVMSKIMENDKAAAALATTLGRGKDGAESKQSEFRPGAGVPSAEH
jgi:limonene 1,2-monooxygenase